MPVPLYYLAEVLEPAGPPIQQLSSAPKAETCDLRQVAAAIADLHLDTSAVFRKPKGSGLLPDLYITQGDVCKDGGGLSISKPSEPLLTIPLFPSPGCSIYITMRRTVRKRSLFGTSQHAAVGRRRSSNLLLTAGSPWPGRCGDQ